MCPRTNNSKQWTVNWEIKPLSQKCAYLRRVLHKNNINIIFGGHLRFGGHFGPFLVISCFVAIFHSIQHEKIYKIPNFHKIGTNIIKTSFSAAILDLAAILDPFCSFLVLQPYLIQFSMKKSIRCQTFINLAQKLQSVHIFLF